MQIFVGTDYRGFKWKEKLVEYLATLDDVNYEVSDLGEYANNQECDYNEPAVAVAKAVRENLGAVGILICGSGHGVTMQANRFKGIRAANCATAASAVLAREHDDANVLCLAAEWLDEANMKEIVNAFLNTNFDNNIERRVRRINRLDEREDYD